MKVGYARVSSSGQNLKTQIQKLKEYGCEKIFEEKKSGKSAQDRIEFQNALDFVRDGDSLVVAKLDRMARSMSDLTATLKLLENKGVAFKALNTDIDTGTTTGKLVFNILGSIAEFERELIRERQRDGIDSALKNGVKFGRKKRLTDEMVLDFKELQQQVDGNKQRVHTNEEAKNIINEKYGVALSRISYMKGAQAHVALNTKQS